MGIFSNKVKNMTLMMCIVLFEDFDHQRPEATPSGLTAFAEPILMDMVREHYYEALRPPNKWNYDYSIRLMPNMTSPELARFDFRDPETKVINDKAKYKEMCSTIKTTWKEALRERFPKYDRNRFEDGFEEIKYAYSPERCTLTASVLMDNIMKPKEEFRL